jgi:energy-coupling factor transporter ATP-binding protein EcfA2
MKISRIKISNILGIEDLEFSPGGFTKITGANGQGKTSILEAIKSATKSGHDATLLRKGAEKGEVVLVLDDGTEIHERVTASATTRNVVRDGKKISRPGDAIKDMIDALSVNPVDFLTARPADRAKVLLECMPITVDPARLQEISNIDIGTEAGHVQGLQLIDFVRRKVYDDRTGTNRAVSDKDATINQLQAAMPAAPAGVEGSEDELRARLKDIHDGWAAESARIDKKLAGLKDESSAKILKIREAAQAEIDAIRERTQKAIDAENESLALIEVKANQQRSKKKDETAAAATPLQDAIRAIVANREASAKRQATMETIKQMRVDLEDLRVDAERQTKAIADIDAYKIELLQSLPIPGIEIIDGEIYREGIPFERLNTAQRVAIAVEIAKLRAGKLAVACLDGMELLDETSLAEIESQTQAAGLQVFVTRVRDEEFGITTE